jgi:dihydroorotate dehydrogenase electron transfer subunit
VRYTADVPIDVDARVIANERLTADYNVIALEAPAIAAQASPGQFVMVRPQRGFDPLLRRPFSIFEILRAPDAGVIGLSLLNKRVGRGTALVFDAEPGDSIQCLGPLGRPFVPVRPPLAAWMVAGGVGLAPFAALGEELSARGVETTLFYGGRAAADLHCLPIFERMGCRILLATEDGSRGARGRVTVPLEQALGGLDPGAPVMIYACGPEPMLAAVAGIGAAWDRPVQVSVERVMGCGLGGCYSCVIPIRRDSGPHFVRACITGPVFRADEIVWEPHARPAAR